MSSFSVIIKGEVGIHARVASIIVNEATKYDSKLTISSRNKHGNLKSIMNVIALGVRNGDEITVTADGSDSNEAIMGIKSVLEKTNLI